jgi:hypothetical protein
MSLTPTDYKYFNDKFGELLSKVENVCIEQGRQDERINDLEDEKEIVNRRLNSLSSRMWASAGVMITTLGGLSLGAWYCVTNFMQSWIQKLASAGVPNPPHHP